MVLDWKTTHIAGKNKKKSMNTQTNPQKPCQKQDSREFLEPFISPNGSFWLLVRILQIDMKKGPFVIVIEEKFPFNKNTWLT